ncbi:hypothetical protein BDV38DRAFT_234748 [Aspergillus pseudotamarii]|uniref:Uncharacterized protein n=1 Tax=Aspergillus pseudotamarii TaxID=132259 RepID=A0A5N6T8A0_ASPPS|nr:uncharacterized protein BDV38DRAFT_234748 [Aspergillus pseudotamarii]KAE8142411.1 hypothetical protein BDV38DRAFT_234748 [Aspergillus pseudotamarii]
MSEAKCYPAAEKPCQPYVKQQCTQHRPSLSNRRLHSLPSWTEGQFSEDYLVSPEDALTRTV